MNQQSLFDVLEPDAGALERELFAEWEPVLHSACKELGLKQESFYLQDNKGYTSVYFNSALVARMHIRGREHYISIPDSWKESLPEGVKPKRQKDGYARIKEEDAEKPNVVRAIVYAMALHFPKEFDCCSRFAECSDARQCTNPDHELALGCGYRKILASGRILCGENRNV